MSKKFFHTCYQQEIDWTKTTYIYNEYLDSIGLSATSYQTLCCITCQMIFPPSQMINHLKHNDTHGQESFAIDHKLYAEALERCNIPATLVLPPIDICPPPLIGLSVHQGLSCNECFWIGMSLNSLRWNYSTLHRGTAVPDTPASCYAQRYNNSGVSWFRVQTPSDSSALSMIEEDVEDLQDM